MQVKIAHPGQFVPSGQVARVGAEGFLSGALAQPALLEIAQEGLSQVLNGAAKLAADGGFVDIEDAGDLKEGALVEVIGGQQKSLFGASLGEGLLDGGGEQGQLFGGRRGFRSGC